MPELTMGSLFDGIGVFPLAASRHGIVPVWASEIVPDAISITKRHFPEMIHLGDITALSGSKIPAVDVITFGSPCQNFSQIGVYPSSNPFPDCECAVAPSTTISGCFSEALESGQIRFPLF